ncbi:MAG: chromate transporter [Pseudoflavonifractor capillosus]|uniref:Chromate transport protein n=1 Tax=Pseudoflavonifractor capillosus ATCC 29799 TaxID=411467 RepID=A6NPL4_9FIRM|nr:chromate transporter [Pseudoflavonifractor capillosus]EDN02096.1 chromate transport protein [Pseudoflavonifractor capillosus ATCC 29799]MCI5929461.1 chromate transporter [Pseudoflavonifractor capillosus]MDY4660093.1 chromate transporter [Pseudoflavonifractor capillosus]
MIFLRLFYEFFKVGLFSVGGGLATLPFLRHLGEVTGWFSAADLANMVAVSESTPGAMGINMATYVGFTVGGQSGLPGGNIVGAVIATLGLVAPSILVILIIAKFLQKFRQSRVVDGVFSGLRPASTGLIAAAGLSVAQIALLTGAAWTGWNSLTAIINWKGVILAAVVFVCMQVKALKKLHPIVYIAAAAVIGVVFQF